MKIKPTGNASDDIATIFNHMMSFYRNISNAQNSDDAEWNRAIASREAGPGMRRANSATIDDSNKTFYNKLLAFRDGFNKFKSLYDNDKKEAVKLIKDTEKFLKDCGII